MATFDLESYAPVQERIAQFVQDFPEGSIQTVLVRMDGPEVIFEARVYRTPEHVATGVYTNGFAREVEGKSPVNRTSHLENCETSAIGRALANLGYATDAQRPSRSEMIKVKQTREDHDALLEYIKTNGPKVAENAMLYLFQSNDRGRPIKQYVRENWQTIKEQIRVARMVADAIEKALSTQAPTPPDSAEGFQARPERERLHGQYFSLLEKRGIKGEKDRHVFQKRVTGKESVTEWQEADYRKAIAELQQENSLVPA